MLPQAMHSSEQKYMWNHAGTALLISIWSDSSVQRQLTATLRNQPVWDAIARYLTKKGFRVSGKQCRTRIKNMLVRYREIKKKSSNLPGSGIEAFYDDIDRVMKNKSHSAPQSVAQSIPKDSVLAEIISQDVQDQGGSSGPSSGKLLAVKTEASSPVQIEECTIQHMQEVSNDSSRYQNFFETVDTTMDEPAASPGSSGANQVPQSQSAAACRSHHEVLERTVQRLLEAQSAAAASVLSAQSDFLAKVLEAERERHARLEAKLDLVLERLERGAAGPGREQHLDARLGRLLDRLEWALPLAAYPPPGIFHAHPQPPPPPPAAASAEAQLQLGVLLQNLSKYVRAQRSPEEGET